MNDGENTNNVNIGELVKEITLLSETAAAINAKIQPIAKAAQPTKKENIMLKTGCFILGQDYQTEKFTLIYHEPIEAVEDGEKILKSGKYTLREIVGNALKSRATDAINDRFTLKIHEVLPGLGAYLNENKDTTNSFLQQVEAMIPMFELAVYTRHPELAPISTLDSVEYISDVLSHASQAIEKQQREYVLQRANTIANKIIANTTEQIYAQDTTKGPKPGPAAA